MKKKTLLFLILLLPLITVHSGAQESREIELTAQGILARVDRVMEYPAGLIKGKIKHVSPDGKSYDIGVTGYITQDNYLFRFSSSERGSQLKVLYNLGGEDIWVYNIHSLKLFHKLGIDKYDPVLATNFYFIDLSGADLQSNYTAEITGEAFVRGRDSYRLVLNPIFRGGSYGMLTLYVDKKEFVPLRIDYHDRDRAIFKFMTVVKTVKRKGRITPIRYDMMDIRKGTVTIMRFFDFDENVTFKSGMFRSENLGE